MQLYRTPAGSEQPVTDGSLVRRIRLGDTVAFERVFRDHYGNLCDFVDGYVRSRSESEEIVQDLFFALWLRRADWKVTSTLRAYFFAVARSRALGWRRRDALERGVDADSLVEALHTGRLGPEYNSDATDEARRLHDAIAALPERARLAVRLRWLERMRYPEIVEAMGISLKGVEKLVTSALRAVRPALDPSGQHDTANVSGGVSDKSLDRYLAGEASTTERSEVEAWLAADLVRAKAAELLRGDLTGLWDVDHAWRRINERIVEYAAAGKPEPHTDTRPWTRSPAVQMAAVAVVLLAIALAAVSLNRARSADTRDTTIWTTAQTSQGEHFRLELGDGSTAFLGPSTTLQYSMAGTRATRLTGAAIFNVVHNPTRPFVVHARNVMARVLGTEFVVRADPRDQVVFVGVISGTVRVTSVGEVNGVTLSTREVARVSGDGATTVEHHVDPAHVSAWVTGRSPKKSR